MYKGYVVKVDKLRKHNNADKLQIATFFGNDTIVDLSTKVGDIGVYFPVDGQLSTAFAVANNLVRMKDDAGNQIGGFLDPEKRNIKAIRLRGEKSDGLYLPLSCLATFGDISTLKVGDIITVFNGHEICRKYIPKRQHKTGNPVEGNKTRKTKEPIAPLFAEHADTEQLPYNLGAFKPYDDFEVTLKLHGTSQRTGYLPIFKGYKRSLWDKITGKQGVPIYDWGYVSGTRRVVLEDFEGGFYGSNAFREKHSKFFEGKLNKGETVYYEVVGYTDTGAPIMAECNNKKVQDKEFSKQYGDKTVFNYQMVAGSDMYVYRMTMTNEDGFVVEYTPDFMRHRCEQMGVKYVPLLAKGRITGSGAVDWVNMATEEDMHTAIGDEKVAGNPLSFEIDAGQSVLNVAEQFYDGPDPIGKTHIREGVVVRIVNKPKFCAYKHKNFYFKVLEGIIKDTANYPDIEEAQEIDNA